MGYIKLDVIETKFNLLKCLTTESPIFSPCLFKGDISMMYELSSDDTNGKRTSQLCEQVVVVSNNSSVPFFSMTTKL